MQKLLSVVCCLLGGAPGLVPAEESKPLTEKAVGQQLAIVQSYLGRDPARLPAELTPKEHRAAHEAVANVLKHVGGLPEGSPVRLKAIALARKYSAVSEYPDSRRLAEKQPNPDNYRIDQRAHAGLNFAWGVLRQTKVLRDGMRLEEVVGLLGQPTATTPERVEWWYRSHMHVNPRLQYWRVDARKKKGSIVLSHD
jgi:hypothetical protein